MFDLTGTIKDFSLDYSTGKPKVTVELNEKTEGINMYEGLKSAKKLSVKFDKQIDYKRSKNANAYFWVLCGKLAAKTKQNKIDIYKEFIRNIGDNFDVFSVKNEMLEEFTRTWGGGHLGWTYDIIGDSDEEGHTDVVAYYGSSTYNSSQMNALIDAAVYECKEQEIEVLPPDKIEKLKNSWKSNNN